MDLPERISARLGSGGARMTSTAEITPAVLPIPQYYRAGAVAERLSLSEKTIIRYMKEDPDVLVLTNHRKGTRKYHTYLIPDTSLQRFLASLKQHG
jgi:hypothetical protein